VQKLFKKGIKKQAGLPPGTLIFTGEEKVEKIKINILDYKKEQYEEKVIENIEDCYPYKDTDTVTWININGLHDIGLIEKIGECFKIHPLVLEDILNVDQRPKIEDHDDYIFVVLKMLKYDRNTNELNIEHMCLILTNNCVISLQESEVDVFSAVRQRIKMSRGRIRVLGTDYLVYALIDSIVDGYYTILEVYGEKLQDLEKNLVENPTPNTLQLIHNIKRDMAFIRRSVWPLREVINALIRGESKLIHEKIEIYLKDIYDHTIQVIDTIETLRDIISGMIDLFMSSISNKMNEVMKVLTIIATIFIPLGFLAGLYGMNFKNMPELNWYLGYPMLLLGMLIVALFMLGYFRKKKWL